MDINANVLQNSGCLTDAVSNVHFPYIGFPCKMYYIQNGIDKLCHSLIYCVLKPIFNI